MDTTKGLRMGDAVTSIGFEFEDSQQKRPRYVFPWPFRVLLASEDGTSAALLDPNGVVHFRSARSIFKTADEAKTFMQGKSAEELAAASVPF